MNHPHHTRKNPSPLAVRAGQRGISLIELMVGIVIGLMVVLAALGTAAYTTVSSTAVSDTVRMSMQSQQLFDVIGRHLRQAGSYTLTQPGSAGVVTFQSGIKSGTTAVGKDSTNLVVRHGTQVPVNSPANAPSQPITNCLGAAPASTDYTTVNTFSLDTTTNEFRCNPGSGIQSLGDNVEAVMFRYGIRSLTGNLTYQPAADVSETDWALVEAVEVCLQLRGDATNSPSGVASYLDCTNTAVTPTDRRIHRVYRRVMSLRPDPRGGA